VGLPIPYTTNKAPLGLFVYKRDVRREPGGRRQCAMSRLYPLRLFETLRLESVVQGTRLLFFSLCVQGATLHALGGGTGHCDRVASAHGHTPRLACRNNPLTYVLSHCFV